jgi:uroporphyrinogen decarboxylase
MIATLSHRKPDRVPIQLAGTRLEVMAMLKKHYHVESVEEVSKILAADMYRFVDIKTRWGDYETRINGELHGAFGNIGPTVLLDERTFEDRWGVVSRVGRDGRYVEWVSGPFTTTDDLDSFPWPDEKVFVPDDALASSIRALKDAGYWTVGDIAEHPFKRAWHMRGFENFLCDYIANPAWVERIYERLLGYLVPWCRRAAAAGTDMIEFWGDVAMQDRMIVPPERWRELDKPVWKRIIRETRKVKPDIKFFFHSDGNVTPIIDDIIEVGFDILNPLQPECVNPGRVKARWGERITLDGGGSVQRTLPFGTVDDVRREVDFLMRCCAYDGGYIFRASNAISFDCPVENVVTFFETARDYDLSKLTGPPDVIPDPPPCMSVPIRPRVLYDLPD